MEFHRNECLYAVSLPSQSAQEGSRATSCCSPPFPHMGHYLVWGLYGGGFAPLLYFPLEAVWEGGGQPLLQVRDFTVLLLLLYSGKLGPKQKDRSLLLPTCSLLYSSTHTWGLGGVQQPLLITPSQRGIILVWRRLGEKGLQVECL